MSLLSGRTPFVGRQRELAALLERLATAGHGQGGMGSLRSPFGLEPSRAKPQVVLLAGEPGIGKTRLMGELAERARGDGWQVLAGRASESEGVPPYLPFTEALRDYVRTRPAEELREMLGPDAPEVALVARELYRRLPELRPAPDPAVEHERYHVFEAVVDFLLAIARSAGGLRTEDAGLSGCDGGASLSPQAGDVGSGLA